MPSLGGATEWLNCEPLGPAELRGHVVLVNFWTLTCINWLRQEPYVRAWSQAYRDDGLVVIGVHTPEFSFEHDTASSATSTSAKGATRSRRKSRSSNQAPRRTRSRSGRQARQ
jgi:thiol-disulfide isomerase/thioredoxin